MPNRKNYREWLSQNELPLQALVDLLEGVEPSATDCKLLARYKLYYNDNSSPVGLFSEEEHEGGLVDEFCESLLRVAHNGHRSSSYLQIYNHAEKSLGSGQLHPSSHIGTSALPGFKHAIPPIYWIAPQTFIRWARSNEYVFPIELTEALPDYSTWLIMESWPLHAACSLVYDIAPPAIPDELSGDPKKLYELADNSRERLQVKAGRVKPLAFAVWTLELGYHVPPALQDLVDGSPPGVGDEEAQEPQPNHGITYEATVAAASRGNEEMPIEELVLDEVDVAILKVLANYSHAVPFVDLADALPPGCRRNRNTVSRRCRKLKDKGLVSLPGRGAQIKPAGRSIVDSA